jgi:hypothetical protein
VVEAQVSKPDPVLAKKTPRLRAEAFFFGALLAAYLWRALSFPLYSQDTWFYLKTGEVLVQERAFPQHDRFGQGTEDRPWLRNAWLFSVGSYLAARTWGLEGLGRLRVAVASAGLLLVYAAACGAGLPPAAAVLGLLWAFEPVRLDFTERPQLLSYFFFAAFITALRLGGVRRVLALFLLGALWANVHDSCVLMAALGLPVLMVEALRRERPWSHTLWALLAMTGGLLLSPSGGDPFVRVFEWFTQNEGFRTAIPEWRPPALSSQPLFMLFVPALILGLAWQWRQRGSQAFSPAALVALAMTGLAFSSRRFLPFALTGGLLWAAEGPWPWSPRVLRWLPAATLMVLALLALRRWTDPSLGHPGPLWVKFPVGAAEFLAKDPPAGRLANTRWDGDYLLWRLGPAQKVFVDSRLNYPASRLAREETLFGGAPDWRQSLAGYHITALLVPLLPSPAPIDSLIAQDPGWRVVYQDATSRLYATSAERGSRHSWPGPVSGRLKARPQKAILAPKSRE